jgi:hypothetical protein
LNAWAWPTRGEAKAAAMSKTGAVSECLVMRSSVVGADGAFVCLRNNVR